MMKEEIVDELLRQVTTTMFPYTHSHKLKMSYEAEIEMAAIIMISRGRTTKNDLVEAQSSFKILNEEVLNYLNGHNCITLDSLETPLSFIGSRRECWPLA